MRSLLLIPALALAACGGSDADPGFAEGAVPSTERVAADIDPCEALTPDRIAAAFDVSATDVTVDTEGNERAVEMGMMDAGMMCNYDISGEGRFKSVSLIINGYDSAGAAEATFSTRYRAMTDAELAQVREAGDRAVEQMEAEGRIEAGDPVGEDMGASLARMASSTSFEAIPGIGDQAALETMPAIKILNLPSVPGVIYVRDGAVIYTLSASPSETFHRSAGAFDAIRDAYVALAREVVAR